MNNKDTNKDILNFLFELGQLRRIKHEGWRVIGIEHPESVAEHSLRAAQIGFILAKLENYPNPEQVCTMIVFHDIGEARVGDIHKLAKRYITIDKAKATQEQLEILGKLKNDLFDYWNQVETQETVAGIIAKDADFLEQAVMAKEYWERGYVGAQRWIDNVAKALQTESAKQLLASLKEVNSYDWCLNLKSM